VPTAVNAGLSGATPTAAGTGNHTDEAGGILMTIGGVLLAGGSFAALRRRGHHSG